MFAFKKNRRERDGSRLQGQSDESEFGSNRFHRPRFYGYVHRDALFGSLRVTPHELEVHIIDVTGLDSVIGHTGETLRRKVVRNGAAGIGGVVELHEKLRHRAGEDIEIDGLGILQHDRVAAAIHIGAVHVKVQLVVVAPCRPVGVAEKVEYVTRNRRIVQTTGGTAERAGRIVVVQSYLHDVVSGDFGAAGEVAGKLVQLDTRYQRHDVHGCRVIVLMA